MTPIETAFAALALCIPLSIAAMNAALAGLSVILLFNAARGAGAPPWRKAWDPASKALCVYAAAAALSAAAGLSPAASLPQLLKELHKLWVYAVLVLLWPAGPQHYARRLLAAGLAAAALLGSAPSLFWLLFDGRFERAHAFVHPVTYGQQMALACLGGLCFAARPEPEDGAWARRAALAFSALCGLALLLSGTRGALLGLAAGLLAAAVFDPAFRRWGARAAAAALAGLLLLELATPSDRSFLRSLASEAASPQFNRLALWEAAWGMFRERPLLGVGPGNYGEAFPRFFQGELEGQSVWSSAHNLYLHQLAERGAAGALALAWLMWTLTARAVRGAREQATAVSLWRLGALCAFWVMNATEVALQKEQLATLILFLYAWGETERRLPPGDIAPNSYNSPR